MAACVGARVWVSQENGWTQAIVSACGGSQLRVRLTDDCTELELDNARVHLHNSDDVEDMTTLAFLHEPGVLWNLQTRYQREDIYTYTGSILIAVNPFEPVPHLYGTNLIERYRTLPREQLPPHVYATACTAYRNMMRDRAGQAILVTGESGAGKTETAKLIMACLTHLGAHHGSAGEAGEARQRAMSGVEQKILESNPLLEAFGNAKTLRNNNSSRFGKYVEIFFDPAAGGTVTGAAVRTYLLERSRVVSVNNPERSFHIFYQLVDGASPEDRAAWRLPTSAAGFMYLARSSCFELPGQDNAEEYQHTRRAMSHIGLSDEQQSAVLATVAAVLHLGNIVFEDGEGEGSDGREGARVAAGPAQEALEVAAALLGVDPAPLAEALTTRQIPTPEGLIATPLSAQAAADARDSMAKVLYARVFEWLVAAVNTAVDEAHNGACVNGSNGVAAGGAGSPQEQHLSIGLLDIYGFESFEVNDLEQLCINLTNEKLQQHFNQHVFKWEQAEYEREGVDWSYISFRDNADVLELLEGRMGLMDLLDETCRFPRATAEDLAHKYGSSPALTSSTRFTRLKRPATSFSIEHYAGSVTYSTRNFLDKNKDYVVAEHQALLGRSTRLLLQELFTDSSAGESTNGNGGRSNQFQFRSVSSQCRRQLAELMGALSRLQPHYVRCIKPNGGGTAGQFNAPYSLQQLRCGGVMEAVRIACAGFAYRRPYAAFLEHFWQLRPEAVHALRQRLAARGICDLAAADAADLRPVAEIVLAASDRLPASSRGGASPEQESMPGYFLGHTKVFLRATVAAALERQRVASANAAATTIQAHFRRLQVQRWYQEMLHAIVTVQAHCRGMIARRHYQELRCQHAATVIQRAWRACAERLRYQRLRHAATVLQAAWRGLATRRAVEAIRLEQAALVVQTAWRCAVVRREYLLGVRLWRAAVKIQAAWRGYAARQLYLQILPLHRTALVLTRIWRHHRRGAQLAERLRSAFLTYMAYNKFAVVIQAAWRGKVARQLARRLKMQQRRARFLAAATSFMAGAPEAGTCAAPLPCRTSPDLMRRTAMCTPPSGPRPYCRSVEGSGRNSMSGRSAETTPTTSGEVVRSDDLASHPDRENRVRARLAELQDFKVSPLMQYWQRQEAAVTQGSGHRGAAAGVSRGRGAAGAAGGGGGNNLARTGAYGSPVRQSSTGRMSSPRPMGESPLDVASLDYPIAIVSAVVDTRRCNGSSCAAAASNIASMLDDTAETYTTASRGSDLSSRGGSSTLLDEGSLGLESCDPLMAGYRHHQQASQDDQHAGSQGAAMWVRPTAKGLHADSTGLSCGITEMTNLPEGYRGLLRPIGERGGKRGVAGQGRLQSAAAARF